MKLCMKRAGFSLIEVNMAILIAAGGLLSLFALFPTGLRQSVMSQADMYQCTFANSFFDTVAANVRNIEDVTTWNQADKFWAAAVKGTGISTTFISGGALTGPAKDLIITANPTVHYVYVEGDDGFKNSGSVLLPPQYLIRIHEIQNEAKDANGKTLKDASGKTLYYPTRYALSLVSSDQLKPAIYHRNAVYHSEFYFNKRP